VQLHRGEGMPQDELHGFAHVSLSREWLLDVVAHVGTLKKPSNDLTQDEDADDGAILLPANEKGLRRWIRRPSQPGGEATLVGWRRHPGAMQPAAPPVGFDDRRRISRGGLAKVNPPADLQRVL
jgi:hypothetical protein